MRARTCACVRVDVHACAHARVLARARARECVRAFVRARARACVRARMCVRLSRAGSEAWPWPRKDVWAVFVGLL